MGTASKFLIALGVTLVVMGFALPILAKIPFLGRLPGDFMVRRENFTFYFPLTTCLLISALITLFISIFGKK